MTVGVVGRICFDIVRVRTSHVCRGFHASSKQHYARAAKRHTVTSQILNAADVPLQQPPSASDRLDDIRGIIEPLTDNNQFE